MTSDRDLQRTRAAQAGFVMRSYRESFVREDGGRGITQEELLTRMGETDETYAKRYSHTTVSRWESGHTRPTIERLAVFGRALNLSEPEVAGLILLAGLVPDFAAASTQARMAGKDPAEDQAEWSEGETHPGEMVLTWTSSMLFRGLGLFLVKRFLPLSIWIVVLGYALSFSNWDDALLPVVYVGLTVGAVLAQGFVFPGRDVPLREFFWISIFFVLSTPLLEFAPILMDHYNFYTIGDFAGTPTPYVLALLVNLVLSCFAGMMFDVLWKRLYRRVGARREAFPRAAWVALLPLVLVFGMAVVITNLAVTIQLAFVFAALAAVFASLLLIRDPSLNPGERDQRVLFPTVVATALVTGAAGLFTIMFVYASPHLPSVLPDHNLLASWDIKFDELGYSREEALQRINLGYLWHAMCLFVYMLFVVGGRLLVELYRIGGGDAVSQMAAAAGQTVLESEASGRARRRSPLSLAPIWSFSKTLFPGKG